MPRRTIPPGWIWPSAREIARQDQAKMDAQTERRSAETMTIPDQRLIARLRRVAAQDAGGTGALLGQAADAIEALTGALQDAQRLVEVALPQFDWGRSALDADAIRLLNEVPGTIARALRSGTGAE